MLDRIEQIDRNLMLYLNGIHNPLLDDIMHFISRPIAWIPLYMIVTYMVYKKYNMKAIGIFLLMTGLTILLADRISVMAFKDVVRRYRPCHNGEIGDMIHIVNDHCGGKFGFVSSHATNFFGMGIFFGSILRKSWKWMLPLMIFWAAMVGYSRIYLGVHYPLDVLGGALLGSVIGLTTYWGFYQLVIKKNTHL